jgi:hypothetical protein
VIEPVEITDLAGTHLDRERPLRRGGRPPVDPQELGRRIQPPEPVEPRRREHDGIEVVADALQPRVDVAADLDHVEVGPPRQQLRAAAR